MNKEINKDLIKKEISYSIDKINECPNNESPFNYIRGLLEIKDEKKNLICRFSDFPFLKSELEKLYKNNSKNYHCLALLLDIEIEEKNKDRIKTIVDSLVEIDFIRKKYWLWKKAKVIY